MSDQQTMDVVVRDDPENQRYVALVDDDVAGFADYHEDSGCCVFPHTVVEDGYGGQGVGKALVRTALDDVRARGGQMVPVCPFFAAYIEKHPEYQDLVERDLYERLREDD